jgi:MFS family permease
MKYGTATRPLLAAVLASTFSVLPVHLLGASAVLMRNDLHFNQADLGLGVAAFFAAFGLVSWVAGYISQTWGPRAGLLISTTFSCVSLLGIAAFVHDWTAMLVFLMIGGVANAFAQTGGNLALASGVGVKRQGLAFGLKQSAVPLSSLVSGAAVPLIGLTFGWRWSFVTVLVLGPVLYGLLAHGFMANTSLRADERAPATDWSMLIPLAMAYGAAAGASATLGAFLVESAVFSGVHIAAAGGLLAIGSVVSIVSRLVVGWLVDRRGHADLMIVAIMLFVGSVGYLALATGSLVLFTLGAAVAFGAGWGWNGVFNQAIVSMNKRNPGTATGVAMMGMAVGGILWPLAFGILVTKVSFAAAWIATAGLSFVAAVILVVSVRQIRLRAGAAYLSR